MQGKYKPDFSLYNSPEKKASETINRVIERDSLIWRLRTLMGQCTDSG